MGPGAPPTSPSTVTRERFIAATNGAYTVFLLRQTDTPLAARLLVGRAVQLRLRDVLPQRRPVGEHARRDAAHELAVRARLHERRAAVEDPVELVAVEADREEVRRRDFASLFLGKKKR